MSYQAIEAIQDHSQVEDPIGRHILMAIGRYADPSGVVGAAGKSPSIRTIAEKAHCHRNTVLNWMPKLEERNELQVKRKGKGRGARHQYKILLPIAEFSETTPRNNGTRLDVTKSQSNGTGGEVELAQRIDLLAQAITTNGILQDVPDPLDPLKEDPGDPNTLESNPEHVRVTDEMLEYWGQLFPKKTQPKPQTNRAKVKTRLKDPDFESGWRYALEEAALSLHLQTSSWFCFEFFVRNDANWRKCRDRYYASFDVDLARQNGQNVSREEQIKQATERYLND